MVRRQTLDLLIEVRILTGQHEHRGFGIVDCRSYQAEYLQYDITNLKSTILKRPYRLTVRTEPSQGSNTGSIPVKATNTTQYWVFNCLETSDWSERPQPLQVAFRLLLPLIHDNQVCKSSQCCFLVLNTHFDKAFFEFPEKLRHMVLDFVLTVIEKLVVCFQPCAGAKV